MSIALAPAISPIQAADTAGHVELNGFLLIATDEPGARDPRLQRYESNLRKLFRFSSYRLIGEGRRHSSLPGESSLTLGKGYSMYVEVENSGKDRIRARVKWSQGERILIHTTAVLRRDNPLILGGPAHENGTLILILLAK